MLLQRRLTLLFVGIVIIPLAVAGYFVQRVAGQAAVQSADEVLSPALDHAALAFTDDSDALSGQLAASAREADLGGLLAGGDRAAADASLDTLLRNSEALDFILLVDESNDELGSAVRPPELAPGAQEPTARDILEGNAVSPTYVKTEIPLRMKGKDVGSLIGGFWFDNQFLASSQTPGTQLSVVNGTNVVASTAPLQEPEEVTPDVDEVFQTTIGEESRARAQRLSGPNLSDTYLVASIPLPDGLAGLVQSILGLLVLALIGTALLAYLLARVVTRPLEELALATREIAQGKLDHRIPVRSKDEIGQVALAFNDMTEQMSQTFDELRSSRDLLHVAVHRVGEAMRSTHDMKQMLDSILQTTADAVAADAAILWMFNRPRDELYPGMTRGIDKGTVGHVKVGEGIVGLVAERTAPVLMTGESGGPHSSRREPEFPTVLAVPLFSQDRITGVVTAYRTGEGTPFSQDDLETATFLAEQGGVAIENVLLHEEAQRLSLTDGLTSVWNRRYFQMQFRQVAATAHRFDRSFSVLMLDLDHFKKVNDTHGHQRGDNMLVEFSNRVNATLREVDTFARYGGEEFVCLLFETDQQGAVKAAEKIREAIRAEPFGSHGEPLIGLTVSIGLATFPDHGESYRELLEAADRALYVAKQEGRDCVRTAGAPPGDLRLA